MNIGEDRRIIAIGSGKGGVGKSLMAASFGIALAKRGRRVVLVDADLGGANLHTCLGMAAPGVTLSSFVTRAVDELAEVVVPTGLPRLSLISGASDLLDAANQHHAQKLRLLRHLVKLDFDDLILDLGAGTGFNVLDFYLLAEHGILVIAPEPTSEENAYRFLKAAYLRRLRNVQNVYGIKEVMDRAMAQFRGRGFISTPRELVETVRRADPEVGELVLEEMSRFRPHLLVNQCRGVEDERMGQRIAHTCHHLLGITLVYVGAVAYDDAVWQSLKKHRALLVDAPASRAARAIEGIVSSAFGGVEPVRDWSPAQRLFKRVQLDHVEAPTAQAQADRADAAVAPEVGAEVEAGAEVEPGAQAGPGAEVGPGAELEAERESATAVEAPPLAPPRDPALPGSEEGGVDGERHGVAQTPDAVADPARRGGPDTGGEPRSDVAAAEGVGPVRRRGKSSGDRGAALDFELPAEGQALDGEFLRKVREARGLSLEDVAAKTKIPKSKIHDIEINDFTSFAARVYLRGFVFQIARCLGLDGQRAARSYMLQVERSAG